ncbi:MAG: ATP-binding protein [Propionibacteriaceae bacterium]|nr:ATP-binding protein [Propionibacteriaceae bacterium]
MELLKRQGYLDQIAGLVDAPFIKVLVGIRRSGKSALMTLTQQLLHERGVPPERIIHLNFDNLELAHLTNAPALDSYIKSLAPTEGRFYVLLDEIQEVDQWERVVNSLFAQGQADIYITGSNTTLLSSELATYIAGRYVAIEVSTLSFAEHLQFRQTFAPLEVGSLMEEFTRYRQRGGFPGLYVAPFDESQVRSIVGDIYNSVMIRDVLARHSIRDADLLQRVALFALDNVGNLFSARRVAAFVKAEHRSASTQTVLNYLLALDDAMVITKVPRYDLQSRALMTINEKYYAGDHGLITAMLGNQAHLQSGILENIVWAELRSRGYTVNVGKLKEAEVDLVADRHGERVYVQVTTVMSGSTSTQERELAPLQAINDAYPKYVVSLDPLAGTTIGGIRHVSIPEFLLSDTY